MRSTDMSSRPILHLAEISAWIVLLPVGAFAAIGLFADLRWPFDLFSHFAIQCAVAQLLAIAYFALRHRFLPVLVGLTILLITATPIAPYYWAAPIAAAAPYSLRVMTLNVDDSNRRFDLVRQAVAAEAPDVIFLSEATAQWASAMAPLRAAYPYEIGEMTDLKFSVLLLSRLALHDAEVHHVASGDFPYVSARLCLRADGRCLTVLGIHPPAPTTGARAEALQATFDAVAEMRARANGEPFVLVGDFNATPWSAAFRRLVRATGLRDSAVGFGLHPTFGSRSLLFGQMIDHVLVDPSIAVLDHRVGTDVGSDHYPVVADLSF